MVEWLEIALTVDGEGAEAAADVLRRFAHQGVAIEHALPGEAWEDEPLPPGPLRVTAYVPNDDHAPAVRRQVEEALYYLSRLYPIPAPAFRAIAEEEWAEAWKQHYHPIRIGERLLIKPAWADVQARPSEIVIEMDPGMAFGTGTHPTTQLCLQAMEWFARPGTCMVDLGTGSGVLAIAAAKLGCYRVLALDIDEGAVRAAQDNVARNGVDDRVIVLHGSLDSLRTTARRFDLAVANLTARIILDMLPQGLQHIIWPGGRFIFSGIIDEQAEEVTAALDSTGLKLVGKRQMGDWVMLITQRQMP